jgi:hypothetical protein
VIYTLLSIDPSQSRAPGHNPSLVAWSHPSMRWAVLFPPETNVQICLPCCRRPWWMVSGQDPVLPSRAGPEFRGWLIQQLYREAKLRAEPATGIMRAWFVRCNCFGINLLSTEGSGNSFRFVTASTRSNMATRQLWFNLNRVGIDAISIMMKQVWKSGFYSMTMRPRCPLCR